MRKKTITDYLIVAFVLQGVSCFQADTPNQFKQLASLLNGFSFVQGIKLFVI